MNEDFCNEFFAKQMKTKNRNLDANIGKIIQQDVALKDDSQKQNATTESKIKSLEEQIFNL